MLDSYAHTISRIDFLDGIVRIELAVAQPDGKGGVDLEAKQAIHIPLGGFLRSAETIERFLQDLAKRGVINLGGAGAAAPASGPAAGAPADGAPKTNFG